MIRRLAFNTHLVLLLFILLICVLLLSVAASHNNNNINNNNDDGMDSKVSELIAKYTTSIHNNIINNNNNIKSDNDIINDDDNMKNVLVLTDKNFSKYIIERPRNYIAVIMFTALHVKYDCSVCLETLPMFHSMATHYHQQYPYSDHQNNSANSANPIMFFFVIDVDDARMTFNDMGMTTIPHVYVLPTRGVNDAKMRMAEFELETKYLFEGIKSTLKELSRLSNISVVEAKKAGPILALLSLISICLALVVAQSGTVDVYEAFLWYRNRWIWTLVCLICFAVGVSGSIYCFIRSVPLYGFSRSKAKGSLNIEIFGTGGRDQYLGEGIIVAGWTIGCGVAGGVLYWCAHSKRFPMIRHAFSLLAMATIIVLLSQIWDAYLEKTQWYSFKETIPPEVAVFLSSSVKKSSGLAKRLLRISEIFLFEFKDWPSFGSKAYSMVVEYLLREWDQTMASEFVQDLISRWRS